MEAAFWSQLPGNVEWRTRPGAINSAELRRILKSFDNFPMGNSDWALGHCPLPASAPMALTPYDYIPHVNDVGMTAIFGPIGKRQDHPADVPASDA